MPPTSIDGTDISGATIDGTEVTEITMDGDVVFSGATSPDTNSLAQFDARQLNLSNGDTVTSWPSTDGTLVADSVGSGGDGTYDSTLLAGEPAVSFPDGEVEYAETNFSHSTPFTTIMVTKFELNDNTNSETAISGGDSTNGFLNYVMGDDIGSGATWRSYNGSDPANEVRRWTPDNNIEIVGTYWNGSSSETVSATDGNTASVTGQDTGSQDISRIGIGGNYNYYTGGVGYLEIIDGTPSNGLRTRVENVGSDWGMSFTF